jgi:hypothetical protein
MTDVSGRNRNQGRFAPEHHPVSAVTLCAPAGSPAEVLAGAAGSDRNPNNIPWPEKPANSRVEVFVDPDDMCGIMDNGNWNASTNYDRVYASIDLVAAKDCDFWGIDADGNEHVIVLGVHDYEEAVDPYDHENLNYREGYTNPMPAYEAARKDVQTRRLAAAGALLEDAGISVELEDHRRGEFRLKSGGAEDLQLRVQDFQLPLIRETRNWRAADDTHLAAFLGEGYTPETGKLLTDCASLVARQKRSEAYRAEAGR